MARGIAPVLLLLLALLAAGTACEREAEEAAPAAQEELSDEELRRGVGPVEEVELGPIDPQLAARGEEIFRSLCASCHMFDQRYVGPPLRGVTLRRSPEFILNMILNPDEMARRHPGVRAMVTQYYLVMPDQNLSEEDARAVLEYLRQIEERG